MRIIQCRKNENMLENCNITDNLDAYMLDRFDKLLKNARKIDVAKIELRL